MTIVQRRERQWWNHPLHLHIIFYDVNIGWCYLGIDRILLIPAGYLFFGFNVEIFSRYRRTWHCQCLILHHSSSANQRARPRRRLLATRLLRKSLLSSLSRILRNSKTGIDLDVVRKLSNLPNGDGFDRRIGDGANLSWYYLEWRRRRCFIVSTKLHHKHIEFSFIFRVLTTQGYKVNNSICYYYLNSVFFIFLYSFRLFQFSFPALFSFIISGW